MMNAKHVLVIIDSCYSGGIGTKGSGRLPEDTWDAIAKLIKNPSRYAITAGRDYEIAIERNGLGIFTRHLLEGLKGAADSDGDKVITLSALYNYVQDAVIKEQDSQQTPQLFRLTNDTGEYIFILPDDNQ